MVGVTGRILALFVIHIFVDERTWAARVLRRFLQSLTFYFFFVEIGARVFRVLVVLMSLSLPNLPTSAYKNTLSYAYIYLGQSDLMLSDIEVRNDWPRSW